MVNLNFPMVTWEAAFNSGANDLTVPLYRDITSRVTGWSTKMGRNFELGSMEAGTSSITIDNVDELLNPMNTGSTYNNGSPDLLKLYRRIRCWAMWGPSPYTGNHLNASTLANWNSAADLSTFEGGTTGGWVAVGTLPPTSVVNSTTRAHDGTHSLLVTWPTGAGGTITLAASGDNFFADNNQYPLKLGRQYTVSAWVWLVSGPPVILNMNGVSGSPSSSTTGVWQRITCTFTAAPGDHRIFVYPSAATTAGQQVFVDSIQLEFGASASAFTTAGPVLYSICEHYITRYPETWTGAGFRGGLTLEAVDATGLMQSNLRNVLYEQINGDQPALWWPLDDPATSRTGNSFGNFIVPVKMAPYIIGAPSSGTYPTFGYDSAGPGVDQQFSCNFVTPHGTSFDFAFLYADWNATSGGQGIGGTVGSGISMECWFKTLYTCHVMVVAGVGTADWAFSITATGDATLTTTNNGGVSQIYTISAANPNNGARYSDGNWHHFVGTELGDGVNTTASLYIDGLLIGTASRVSAAGFLGLACALGSQYFPNYGDAFQGQISHAVMYNYALDGAQVLDHWQAGQTAFSGDTPAWRVARLIGYTGWNNPTIINSSMNTTAMGTMSGLSGSSALALAVQAASTEQGVFYADERGYLRFTPRQKRYSQTSPAVVFGENVAGGEIPYLAPTAALDAGFVYNDVTVTSAGNSNARTSDDTSITNYAQRTLTVDAGAEYFNDQQILANYVLSQYKDGSVRLAQVSISANGNNAIWPTVLGLTFGTRVQWKRRTAAGFVMTIDGYIDGIEHVVDSNGTWLTTYIISPLPNFTPGIIGDATQGKVGTTLIMTY